MAAATMTPSRFGNSFSSSQSQYGAHTTSMADSLPTIDFGFNDLRERMAQFTVRFDEFIEKGRKRVLDEHNAFRMNVAELEESRRASEKEISKLQSKSSTHAQNLAKEAAETEEMHEAIQTLTAQKEEHIARRDQLKDDIGSLKATIKQKREAQSAYQRSLDAQARHNVPELRFWEHCLGLRIEGSASGMEDQLRFVFACIDEKDESKECWFELRLGGPEYEVATSKPKLEKERLEEIVQTLNETKDVGPFLKAMRRLFVETLPFAS
ncbi:kinetochore-associated Ndc80 complex subunit spc25 [Saxophila tyrrhenica]|uniref:Kinetochore protein SPC25 n=1 Tax=Saxophila tyrrhenica TaxID=1690608 RepID=A0AAV9P8X3_9PEZI|nr:kinetochore-associated Ndc80 complex subunit spc25 [Saxophila tyrrhenica]